MISANVVRVPSHLKNSKIATKARIDLDAQELTKEQYDKLLYEVLKRGNNDYIKASDFLTPTQLINPGFSSNHAKAFNQIIISEGMTIETIDDQGYDYIFRKLLLIKNDTIKSLVKNNECTLEKIKIFSEVESYITQNTQESNDYSALSASMLSSEEYVEGFKLLQDKAIILNKYFPLSYFIAFNRIAQSQNITNITDSCGDIQKIFKIVTTASCDAINSFIREGVFTEEKLTEHVTNYEISVMNKYDLQYSKDLAYKIFEKSENITKIMPKCYEKPTNKSLFFSVNKSIAHLKAYSKLEYEQVIDQKFTIIHAAAFNHYVEEILGSSEDQETYNSWYNNILKMNDTDIKSFLSDEMTIREVTKLWKSYNSNINNEKIAISTLDQPEEFLEGLKISGDNLDDQTHLSGESNVVNDEF